MEIGWTNQVRNAVVLHRVKVERIILRTIRRTNETLFPNWQKEPWQTFEENSGYMRPERVNKWPNSMTDR
jgi:hypothetical protein